MVNQAYDYEHSETVDERALRGTYHIFTIEGILIDPSHKRIPGVFPGMAETVCTVNLRHADLLIEVEPSGRNRRPK